MLYHIVLSILHFGSSSCLVCIMERITLMGDSFACGLPRPLCFSVQAHSCDCLICWRLGLHTPLALSWFLAHLWIRFQITRCCPPCLLVLQIPFRKALKNMMECSCYLLSALGHAQTPVGAQSCPKVQVVAECSET